MWLTAILLGFAGSLHCVGMCSPLAMVVTQMNKKVFLNRMLYNGGRILSYGLLGILVSTFGFAIRLNDFQNTFSIIAGSLLIIIGLSGYQGISVPIVTPLVAKLSIRLKKLFSSIIQKKTIATMFLLGVLNGVLPCGLTYLALTYCLALVGPVDGFNFMILFGVGTLPVMLGLTSTLQFLIKRLQFNLLKLSRVMLIFLGILLIARTMIDHATHEHIEKGKADIEQPVPSCQ